MKIYFSGMGGSGMSAIAGFMSDKGHIVSGSDRAFDADPAHPALTVLRKKGVLVFPHDASGIDPSLDLAVFSTAVEDESPELERARALGVPSTTRPRFLAELISGFDSIAVAGTSGKSTVSGMLAYVMRSLGMEPNFIGGARVRQFVDEGGAGNSISGGSGLLVVEVCESDGYIVNFRPGRLLVLNLALDHHPVQKTGEMFRAIAGNTSGAVILNADDGALTGLGLKTAASFSLDRPSKYRAAELSLEPLGSSFLLGGTRFRVALPGRHNALNALAAVSVLREMGVPGADIAPHLSRFRGIERRFEVHMYAPEGIVIDDYAHNPHKIASLMASTRGICGRALYIFQPHGFGPTRLMRDGYIEAFSSNLRAEDLLLVLPIYYAGGTVSRDVSSGDLAGGVRASGRKAEAVGGRKEAASIARSWPCVVVMGARDETLSAFARDMASDRRGA